MLEEQQEHDDGSGNINKFPNNEFYSAIMDEDLGRIEDMSKKYGSDFLIAAQNGGLGRVFGKVDTTMQTSFFLIPELNVRLKYVKTL